MKNKKDQRSYKVIQANDFIRHMRTDKLNAIEANIAYFLISKVKPDDKDFMKVTFSVSEFCQVCGVDGFNDSGQNYANVKGALKSLADKSAWVETISERGRPATTLVRWVDTYTIEGGSGVVDATLSQSIKPYLLNLTEHFTQAELRTFLAMKSAYSKRLYELLRSYIHSKPEYSGRHITKEFEILDLKKLLNAENYGRFKDFRVNVLKIAEREINAVSDMELSFTPIKPGRITTHVSFFVKLKIPLERLSASAQADAVLDRTEQLTILD